MRRGILLLVFWGVCGAVVSGSGEAAAAASGASADDLAKAVQNPLAAMVTLPLQANYNTGYGPDDRTLFNLNVQPVIPYTGKDWNMIVRTIIPINSVPMGEYDSQFGIGDTQMTFFLSPAKAGSVVWGVGPVFGLPTSSNPELLGSGKYSVGPAGVLFISVGKLTFGGLLNNLWSFAGDKDRAATNNLTFQWFINANLGNGWAIGTVPIVAANWYADTDEEWVVPFGAQVSKVTNIGNRPINLLVGYYHNSTHPSNGPKNQTRIQINFLFPSGMK